MNGSIVCKCRVVIMVQIIVISVNHVGMGSAYMFYVEMSFSDLVVSVCVGVLSSR